MRPVLLLNPRICSPRSARLPLSLLALGAVLEGKRPWRLMDGNFDPDLVAHALAALDAEPHALVGVTVMPGPQVGPALEVSRAIRAKHPEVPIVWGGYFPTLYTDAALNAPYVDGVVRGPGEETLLALLTRVDAGESWEGVAGLSWKSGGAVVHEPARPFREPGTFPPLPYERLGNVERYLARTAIGRRTAVHQAAIGCRYRCTFCGVVSMFGGTTLLPRPRRLGEELSLLRERWGADAVQFFDHNFFDREESAVPVLEELAGARLPYWVYARADTLAGFSRATWELVRRSRLRMAYIGAEAASDEALRRMHKGAPVAATLEAAARCREFGVVPELSFVLGGPEDPEEETERTLAFVRKLKGAYPECEVILYFYTPTPQREPGSRDGRPVQTTFGPGGPPLPDTPEGWAEPRWVDYVCHRDAPWLTPRVKRRVRDFATVLGCRFPTVQDVRTPRWGKALLAGAASWRWAARVYARPVELEAARRLIPLKEPQTEGL